MHDDLVNRPPSDYQNNWVEMQVHAPKQTQSIKATQLTPVNEKKIQESFQRCKEGLSQADTAERLFLSGDDKSVQGVRNAIDALSDAIEVETANPNAFNTMNVSQMQARKDELSELVSDENVGHLKTVIDAKKEINNLLDEARANPKQAAEFICKAQNAFTEMRQKIPGRDSPMQDEVDKMETRIDSRARSLTLTESQEKVAATALAMAEKTANRDMSAVAGFGSEHDRETTADLGKSAMFTKMVQHRVDVKDGKTQLSNVPPEIAALRQAFVGLNPDQGLTYAFFTKDCQKPEAFSQVPVEGLTKMPTPTQKTELMPQIAKMKVSRRDKKSHKVNISLVEKMKFWKPTEARTIATRLNVVSHRVLQVNQFMDSEIREISLKPAKSGSPSSTAGITNIQHQITELRAEVDGLEFEMMKAEDNPKLGKSELVQQIRQQVIDLNIQLRGLETKRAAMLASYPLEVRLTIKKRDQIADLTQYKLMRTPAKRRADFAKAVALTRQIEVLGAAPMDAAAKIIFNQESLAAEAMIQKAYIKEHENVSDSVDKDATLAKALDVPLPRLNQHRKDLAAYARRGLMQIAVPEHLKPEDARLTPPQREALTRDLERVRALLGEEDWNKLLAKPELAPFKTEYEVRLKKDFPTIHPLQQARYGLMKLASGPPTATFQNLEVLSGVHHQLTALKNVEHPSPELLDQIATLKISLDVQSQRLLNLKNDNTNIKKWASLPPNTVLSEPDRSAFELVLAKVMANAIFGVDSITQFDIEQKEKMLKIKQANPIQENTFLQSLHTEYEALPARATTNPILVELLKYQRTTLMQLQQVYQLFSHPDFQKLAPESKAVLDQFTELLKENLELAKQLQLELDALMAEPKTALELAQALEKTTLNSQQYKDAMLKITPVCLEVFKIMTPVYQDLNSWRNSLNENGQSGDIRLLFNGDPIGDSQLAIQALIAQRPTRTKMILSEMVKLGREDGRPVHFPGADPKALASPDRLVSTYGALSTQLNERTRNVALTEHSAIIIEHWPAGNETGKSTFLQALMSDDSPTEKQKIFDRVEFHFRDMKDQIALTALNDLRDDIGLRAEPSVERILRDLSPVIPSVRQRSLHNMVNNHIKAIGENPDNPPQIPENQLQELEKYFENSSSDPKGKANVAALRRLQLGH